MHILIKTLGWLLTLAVLAATAATVLLILDSGPLVPEERSLTAAEQAWANEWLNSVRRKGMKDGARGTLTLSETEANVLAAYLIDRLGQGRAAIRIEDNRARAAASLGLPWNPNGSFLNLEITVAGTGRLPRIEQVRIAGLSLPGGLVQTLADRLMGALDRSGLLQRVDLVPNQIRLTYEWRRDTLETLGSGLVSSEERARLLHYQGALAD